MKRKRQNKTYIAIAIAAAVLVTAVALALLLPQPSAFVPASPSASVGASPSPSPSASASPWGALPTPEESPAEGSPAPEASPTPAPAQSPAQSAQPAEVIARRDLYEAVVNVIPHGRNSAMTGSLRLTYANKSADPLYVVKLRLHANDVRPGSISVYDMAVNGQQAYFELSGASNSILTVPLPLEIYPGETAELYFSFTLMLPETNNRLGINSNGLMLGNALPIAAVYENGAWREEEYVEQGDSFYSHSADYKVVVNAPADWTLAHTGSLVERTVENGTAAHYITASGVREFAMALVKNGHLATEQCQNGATTVHAIADSRSHAEFAARMGAQAIDFFGGKIGAYPYRDFFVVQFDAQGGMEYPGLVMIHKGYYTSGRQDEGARVIGHETAHQWFYNVVGSDQVRAPWLDDSLVEYLGFRFTASLAGEEAVSAMLGARREAYQKQTLSVDRLDLPLDSFFGNDYYYAVYSYGCELYRALYEKLGESAFYEGLATYYNANSFALAAKENLIAAFSEAAGEDLAPWFEQRMTLPLQAEAPAA